MSGIYHFSLLILLKDTQPYNHSHRLLHSPWNGLPISTFIPYPVNSQQSSKSESYLTKFLLYPQFPRIFPFHLAKKLKDISIRPYTIWLLIISLYSFLDTFPLISLLLYFLFCIVLYTLDMSPVQEIGINYTIFMKYPLFRGILLIPLFP